jgi:two-component system, NarL family, sensor histidine kinase BarA
MKINPAFQVLIVDDNPAFVKFFKKTLNEICGSVIISIHCAFNGKDGLEMLGSNNYHFAFMDIDMPELDWISSTHFLNREFYNPDVQIIAISFHTGQTFRDRILKAGASKYLAKDEIEAEKLIEIFGL